MSKALEATCVAGVVTSEAVPVPGAVIMGEGVGSSSGVLILDEEKKLYFPKTSPDLDATLAQIITALGKTTDAINKVAAIATSIGAGMTGPTTAPPPTLAVDVAALTALGVEVTAAKVQLETLKTMLR